MDLNGFSEILKVVLQIANIVVLAYALYKFLNKPHNTLEERVDKCENDIKDIKQSLFRGDGRFQEMDRALKVFTRSTIALVEFEMQYCLIEHKEMSKGLEKAKEALDEFVAEK